MSPMTIVPAATSDLALDHLDADDQRIVITFRTTSPTAACPICGGGATRVQSRYWRTLADLPWQGVPVHLQLRVRRFWCDTPACPRVIFAERVPAVTVPYARRTVRLTQILTHITFALGGEAGARLLSLLGMAASPDTLLRLIRQAAVAPPRTPRVVGIDDFALRRGHTYGTLLIDLETHRPVDLLPDRTADRLAQWLAAHPGVAIIARDRSGAYADGARQGAPQAIQVADRWHLLKNLGDALERGLGQHPDALRAATQALQPAAPAVPEAMTGGPLASQPPVELCPRQPQPGRRQAQYAQVHALHQQGLTISAISRQVGLTRPTVRKYLRAPNFPERAPHYWHLATLSPHAAYLRQRWADGCHNAALLWRELQARGFTGSAGTVRRSVGAWRGTPSPPGRSCRSSRSDRRALPPARPPSRHQVRWWLLRVPEERTTEQTAYVTQLLQVSPAIQAAAGLTWEFNRLVGARDSAALEAWLEQAETSGLPEFAACAASLRRDRAAVEAALRLVWSNGQTEGQVTKLKLVKRSMYGRAKFDLLRQRVLYRAA